MNSSGMETEVKIGIRSVWSCVSPLTPGSARRYDIDRGRSDPLFQKFFLALFLISAILVVNSQAADANSLDFDIPEFDDFEGNNGEGGPVNVIDENNRGSRARVARSIFDVPIFGTGSDEITCPEGETRSFVEALRQWICMSSNDSNNSSNRKNSNNNTGINTTTTSNSTYSNNSRHRPLRKSSG